MKRPTNDERENIALLQTALDLALAINEYHPARLRLVASWVRATPSSGATHKAAVGAIAEVLEKLARRAELSGAPAEAAQEAGPTKKTKALKAADAFVPVETAPASAMTDGLVRSLADFARHHGEKTIPYASSSVWPREMDRLGELGMLEFTDGQQSVKLSRAGWDYLGGKR